jgi:surface antigen
MYMNFKTSLMALSAMFIVAATFGSTSYATDDKKPAENTETKNEAKETIVTVKAGDTLEKIAKAHGTTYVELFNANEGIANPDQIDVGQKIRIPKKDENLADRFAQYQASVAAAYRAPVATAAPVVQATTTYAAPSYTTAPVNSTSYYVGNGMWCTDYVHSKRPDVAVYGNAGYNWIGSAQAAGKSTGSAPKAGAVAVTNGHVAYVENVNSDGSYTVSEMGWNYQAGQYNKRTVQPGTFGQFIY